MTILEWLNTPADLYAKALECGHEWDEGMREALADMVKADEMKQQTKGKR